MSTREMATVYMLQEHNGCWLSGILGILEWEMDESISMSFDVSRKRNEKDKKGTSPFSYGLIPPLRQQPDSGARTRVVCS